uniref:C2 domain-containing protein n=1 Tax=Dromaius novaehollandiae TaxID=8790 RepID=A0A8C4K5E0_DRONO
MEVEKAPPGAEMLLKTYKWRTAAAGEREPERGTASPGSRPWARLQGWKRSYSQPESDGPEDGAGKGGSSARTPSPAKASARRSLFQRAFSAPSKVAKEPRGAEGGKATLQKYLRSMSKRKGHVESGARAERVPHDAAPAPESSHGVPPIPLAPMPDAPVWDVSNFSLVDGQLVLVGRDEEVLFRSRNQTGSSISDGTSLHLAGGRRDPGERARHGTPRAGGGGSTQFGNVKGLLWKRLRERKGRAGAKAEPTAMPGADGERAPSRSGSRESLLPPPSAAELDLTGDNVIVRPVHGSIVGEKFCFQVRAPDCSIQAPRDNCERVELALSLWVYEARDLPPRRRLRCQLHLDGALYARTTAKAAGPGGELFWGELFQLAALPRARTLTLALCREDDGRPREPLASVTVPLSELLATARQPLERWYPLSGPGHPSGRERPPAVRIRGRYQEVRVLPIVRYKELAEFITFHYRELCARLEPVIAVRHKEELAGALVHVLQSTGKAKAFLIDLGVAELDRFDDREALIFRENTLGWPARPAGSFSSCAELGTHCHRRCPPHGHLPAP